jgi:16S rRNA (uracil1498-N3)-methyltransferase
MSRRRWIADQVTGDRAVLTGADARHLARVLRARPGQRFEVSAAGRLRLGTVRNVSHDRVEFDLGEELPAPALPAVTLLLAVFKFDRMEWAIEKATELGAVRIVPVVARRTDVRLAAAAGKRAERWRRIVHEAAQQSRRLAPPEVAAPLKLKDALAGIGQSSARIVLAESEEVLALLRALPEGCREAALAVGPEGGWTEDELQRFAAAGWQAASLGPTILRAETAALAALAVVMAKLGE